MDAGNTKLIIGTTTSGAEELAKKIPHAHVVCGSKTDALQSRQIYALGYYTGYGAKTIPAARETIEEKQWSLAEEQIGHVGRSWKERRG